MTTFSGFAVFGKAAEAAGELRKGDKVYCEGRIELNTWRAQDGTEKHRLSVASFKLEQTHQIGRARPKRSNDDSEDRKPTAQSSPNRDDDRDRRVRGTADRDLDDEIPF